MKKKDMKLPPVRASKIDSYSAKIQKAWNNSVEGIFAVGDLIKEASSKLSKDEYWRLVNALPFSVRTAQRLKAIAADDRLRDPIIQKKLPSCWSTLYELHAYSDEEFGKAKKEGRIKPSLTRDDAIQYRKKQRISSPSNISTVTGSVRIGGSPGGTYKPALIFEVPKELDNPIALRELHFIFYIANKLFQSLPGQFKIAATLSDSFKLSIDEQEKHEFHTKFIGLARQLENYDRKALGKPELTELQALLSLLGADPDEPGSTFCLSEILSKVYWHRQKLDRKATLWGASGKYEYSPQDRNLKPGDYDSIRKATDYVKSLIEDSDDSKE